MEQAIHDRLKALAASAASTNIPEDGDAGHSNEVDIATIEELILDGRRFRDVTVEDARLLKQFRKLKKLTCNRTGLVSIEGFPTMPSLKILELTDNHITGGLDSMGTLFPNLRHLELGGNHIKSISDLYPLQELKNLQSLGLEMNPVMDVSGYREAVYSMMPQLEILDMVDRLGDEHYGHNDDDEEELDYEDGEEDTTLREFYEKDYEEDEEDEDGDFDPEGEDDEDEEMEEDEEDDETME